MKEYRENTEININNIRDKLYQEVDSFVNTLKKDVF
jgi:hypothetical protein